MKSENKTFLDANRHHSETAKLGYIRSLSGEERSGMQRVMAEEFLPGYTTDLWCQNCVFEMVSQLYHRYDEWIARQPAVVPDVPQKVAANFPSHKQHGKRR